MNAKFLIIMMICINISAVFIANSSINAGVNAFTLQENFILDTFYSGITSDRSLVQVSTVSLSEGFGNATQELNNPQTPGANSGGVSNFIIGLVDGLKMLGALLLILTPIPFLAFITALGVPFLIVLLFVLPIVALYIFSIAEFVRGGSL
jgi:hypothetical protein